MQVTETRCGKKVKDQEKAAYAEKQIGFIMNLYEKKAKVSGNQHNKTDEYPEIKGAVKPVFYITVHIVKRGTQVQRSFALYPEIKGVFLSIRDADKKHKIFIKINSRINGSNHAGFCRFDEFAVTIYLVEIDFVDISVGKTEHPQGMHFQFFIII